MTVYRNFESTQLYKICSKSSGKCLGVVGGSTATGANVEQRTYAGLAGQTWNYIPSQTTSSIASSRRRWSFTGCAWATC